MHDREIKIILIERALNWLSLGFDNSFRRGIVRSLYFRPMRPYAGQRLTAAFWGNFVDLIASLVPLFPSIWSHMMKTFRWIALAVALSPFASLVRPALLPAQDGGAATATAPAQNSAIVPATRPGNWMQRHERINDRAKQGNVDLLFIGDSITDYWQTAAPRGGKEVWEKYYGNRKGMNAGIGGDRTQHVLWRLENGNIDGIHPKLAVVMIGTNNSNGSDNTAEEIAEGIKTIVAKLREKLPETKILLLGIFPRGDMADAKKEATTLQREKNAKASELASKIADNEMVFYLDIGSKFLDADGNIPKDVMPDLLHPNAKGYEIWAEAIEPKVAELMGDKK
jgi:lysophospholipase L1-like esterase